MLLEHQYLITSFERFLLPSPMETARNPRRKVDSGYSFSSWANDIADADFTLRVGDSAFRPFKRA